MCFRKRVDNNVLLGLELAFILGSVKVAVAEQYVAEIAHFVVGIHYCLFRRDAVEEIYGPDPHGEGYTAASAAAAAAAAAGAGAQKSATGPPTAAASAAAAVAAAAAAAATAAVPSSLRRDLLRREERESLDRIEAELANVAYADDDDRVDDWQVTRHATGTLPAPVVLVGLICNDVPFACVRVCCGCAQRSSLNSDEDPPHLRMVTVVQVNEVLLSVPLGDGDNGGASAGTGDASSSSSSSSGSGGEARQVIVTSFSLTSDPLHTS
jgi:hypothetical protein